MNTDKETFDKYDFVMLLREARDEATHYRNIIEMIKGKCPASVQRRIEKVLAKYTPREKGE